MDPLQQQTQQAMTQQPQQPNQQASMQQQMMDAEDDDGYDPEIARNLQMHLDHLPRNLKEYLVQNLDEKSINILGIVNGQEVYDYFTQIYQSQIAPLKQQNSAPSQGMNPGSQPAQMTNPQQPQM